MKIDLHLHTNHSACSSLTIEKIIESCQKYGISLVAITDHNSINGALEFQEKAKKANIRTIIGEEISTSQGHLIGLFLKEFIYPGLSPLETAKMIKKQNGLVYVPHPFDITRTDCLGTRNVKEILPYIDMIEVVNSRTLAPSFLRRTPKFAKKYNLLMVAGSDAHMKSGIGRVLMEIENFKDKADFLKKLKDGRIIVKSNLFYPYISTTRKIYRTLKRKVFKDKGV